jgi:hypothetical protein
MLCLFIYTIGKITLKELRSSDLRQVFLQVDEENDINRVTEYFR